MKIYSVEEKVIDADYLIGELLDIIEEYIKEDDIKDVCEDLRNLGANTYWEEDIDEIIENLSSLADICSKCGGKFKYNKEFEKHNELDSYDDLEEMGYLACEECGYNQED